MSTPSPQRARRWSDRDLQQLISRVLQAGVLLSAAVVALGGVMLLTGYGGQRAEFGVFRGQPDELRTLGGIVRGALALDGLATVQLGLVLLIATPVVRVALTLVAFLIQGDRLYTAMTALVLGLLLAALI